MTFNIGDKVCVPYDSFEETSKINIDCNIEDYNFGKIISIKNDCITISWNDGNEEEYNNDVVIHYDNIFQKINSTKLEWEKSGAKIEDLFNRAAMLLKEAADLTPDIDLSKIYGISSDLFKALDECGWRTSSLECPNY